MPTQVQTAILQRVREVPGIPFAALAHDGSGVRPNDVYTMLAVSLLYAAPLIQYGRVRLYLDVEQARAYAYQSPARLTSRVGSPLPEVTTPLATNTPLLWDGRCFTLVNPGGTTTSLLPEKEPPIQIPSAFFFQLFDTGVIRRLRLQKDLPALSREVDLLMDHASPSDLRQVNGRFEKVVAYLQGEKDRFAAIAPRTLHRWVASFRSAEERFGCGYVGLPPEGPPRAITRPKHRQPRAN